jgi:hypothetical protein
MTNTTKEVNKLNTQLLSWSFIFGNCLSVDLTKFAANANQFPTKFHVVLPSKVPQQKQRIEGDTKMIVCANTCRLYC